MTTEKITTDAGRPIVINAEQGSTVTVFAIEVQNNYYACPPWLDDAISERIVTTLAGERP